MKAKANNSFDVAAILATGRNRYTFNAQADTANIDIFGEIDDWWGFGVRDMAYNLSQNSGKKLNINIHSPGGSVTEGIGIANLIKSHAAATSTKGVGFVASIASIILLAGDTVALAKNAFLMIHNPWVLAVGDSDELRKNVDLLDKMENELASIYVEAMQKRGKQTSMEEVKQLMKEETWFTADEALEAGLIDEIADRVEIAETEEDAEMQSDLLAKFSNVPQALADQYKQFSNTKTNTIMAKDSKSLFAKIGELFATAADEIESQDEQTTELESENTDATMTVEEARELLEREGYTVAEAAEAQEAQAPEQEAETQEESAEELAELVALRNQVAELTKAVKRTKGAQSGAAAGDSKAETDANQRPKEAMPFFDALANVIKAHRPG